MDIGLDDILGNLNYLSKVDEENGHKATGQKTNEIFGICRNAVGPRV